MFHWAMLWLSIWRYCSNISICQCEGVDNRVLNCNCEYCVGLYQHNICSYESIHLVPTLIRVWVKSLRRTFQVFSLFARASYESYVISSSIWTGTQGPDLSSSPLEGLWGSSGASLEPSVTSAQDENPPASDFIRNSRMQQSDAVFWVFLEGKSRLSDFNLLWGAVSNTPEGLSPRQED